MRKNRMLTSPYKKPRIAPLQEHPRLMLRKSDVERIKNNFTLKECEEAVALWHTLCDMKIVCEGATPEFGTYDLSEYLSLEAKALRALLSEKREDAREAIECALLLLRNSSFDKGIMKARWSGHLIFVCSEVYDWCYSYLGEDEKSYIISECEGMAEKYFEMGYPPIKQAAISGHGSEAQLLRDLLSLGIAVYDERPDIYDFCAGRIFDEYVPSYDFMLAGGYHPQGPAYGAYRYTCLLWAELLLYSMSGERVFTHKLASLADSFIYMTRPDGEAVRIGDDFYEKKAAYTRGAPFAVPMFFAWSYTGKDRYREIFLRGLSKEYLLPSHRGIDYYAGGSYGEGLFSPAVQLIWSGLTKRVEDTPLPCRKYFSSPVGMTVWKDSERLIIMKIGELWGSNHDHLDTGSFQIYSGGILASDSGMYDSYNTPHRKCYAIRTSAHNCITVSDPKKPLYGEWKEGAPYDGGTRNPCGGKEPKTLESWKEDYRMAKVLSHTESDTVCEIIGDMTEAYFRTCKSAVRRMTWEPEKGEYGTLTVSDSIDSLSDEYVKAFHIHCQHEPKVDGRVIVIDNGSCELHCRVLLPSEADISVIGGDGKRFITDGTSYEAQGTEDTEAGWGQIIITHAKRSIHTDFKIEMEIKKKKA